MCHDISSCCNLIWLPEKEFLFGFHDQDSVFAYFLVFCLFALSARPACKKRGKFSLMTALLPVPLWRLEFTAAVFHLRSTCLVSYSVVLFSSPGVGWSVGRSVSLSFSLSNTPTKKYMFPFICIFFLGFIKSLHLPHK